VRGDARNELEHPRRRQRHQVVEYLLTRQVDVNALDDAQKSALHLAASVRMRE